MAQPVALTLKGDGRVVVLTPATVRQAFFRLIAANGLCYLDVRAFEVLAFQSPSQQSPPLQRLFHREEPAYLTPFEVRAIERQMNRLLIRQGLALVENEGRILQGTVSARGIGLRWQQTPFLICHGILFELEALRREVLLAGGCRDVVIERHDQSVEILRFAGVGVDHRQGRMLLRFAHRLDLKQTWTAPQAEFRCRRLFTIRRVAACEGFRLVVPVSNRHG